MRTLAATVLWLLGGAALAGTAYWQFLNTPESTIWSLGLSAGLVVGCVAIVSITLGAALLAATGGWSRETLRRALRGVLACVPPLLLVLAAWWGATQAVAWLDRSSGQISAWFIATLGWSDVTGLFTTAGWLAAWVRWVGAPVAALVWWRSILTTSWRPTGGLVRRMLSPLRLGVATLAFAIFFWAPWTYLVPWRPSAVPTTAELPFVALKFGLSAVLGALGAAILVRTAALERSAPVEPPTAPHATTPPGPAPA